MCFNYVLNVKRRLWINSCTPGLRRTSLIFHSGLKETAWWFFNVSVLAGIKAVKRVNMFNEADGKQLFWLTVLLCVWDRWLCVTLERHWHRVLVLLFCEVLPQPQPDARTQRSEKSFTEITLFKMPVNVSAAAQTETAAGVRFKVQDCGPRAMSLRPLIYGFSAQTGQNPQSQLTQVCKSLVRPEQAQCWWGAADHSLSQSIEFCAEVFHRIRIFFNVFFLFQ